MCRAVLDSPWNSRANQRTTMLDSRSQMYRNRRQSMCEYVCMYVCMQTILLLECSCQVTGYVKDIRCAQVAPVLLSVCVCLIFPLAKMINALGDNIRYSLFTYSLIHSYIRHSAFNIHWSLLRWCRQAGRPSLTHETSCFDKGALPQTHQQRDTILCHTHTHIHIYT